MAPPAEETSTALTHIFHYENATHSFEVKWGSIGDPRSPPLVFVHGTPWTSRIWEPFALALSRQFHVYYYDRPGFGESPPERKRAGAPSPPSKVVEYDSDLARQAEVFAGLYESWRSNEWGKQKPHVVAHDNAGLITLRAHLLHKSDYASLALINVVAIGPFGQPLFKAIGEDPHRFEQLPDSAIEGLLESYIRNAAFFKLSSRALRELTAPWLTKEGGKEGFIRELCQANWRSTEAVEGRYGEVGTRLPVKVIWGVEDRWIPVDTAERLGAALRAKEIVLIPKAGHLVMLDQPAQLGVELGRWLTAVSLPSR